MTFEISDEGIFQITKVLYSQFVSENNMKKLDVDRLDQFKKMFIKPLYPHKQFIQNGQKKIEKYECGQYCCQLNPGRFCCCNTVAPDPQYRQFGLGVCLYIKFMKHLALFLFFVSIMILVSIGLYQVVAFQTGYEMTQNYQSAFFSTTIGTLSSQFVKCEYSIIQLGSAKFNLTCASGKVNLLKPVFTNNTLSSLLNCRQQNMKYILERYYPSTFSNSVYQNPQNTFQQINLTIPDSTYENYSYSYLAYNYECIDSQYAIGPVRLPSPTIILITVGIDIFIVLMFIIFMISQHKAEDKQIQYFKTKQLAVHDFTVKLSGFRFGTYQAELDQFIRTYNQLREQQGKHDNHFINNIVQVKVPQIQQIKQALQRRRDCYEELYDLMYLCFFDDQININSFANAGDFIRKLYGNADVPQYKQYKRRLTGLVQNFTQSKRLKIVQNQIQISILMILTNPKHKKQMIRFAKSNCCGHYIKVQNKKYYVNEPPVADMVIWQNKYKFTFCRVIFAWIITLGIVLGSYLLVAFAQFKKQQSFQNNKFNIDCNKFFTSADISTWQQAVFDAASTDQNAYVHCYCNTNYIGVNILGDSMRATCSKWFSQYIVFYSIPILISFGIVVYNVIVSRIFRILSKFQAHENLSSQLYSYIIKRSFMLVMNMGLIIILLKIHFRASLQIQNLSFLFQGTYNDLTSDWYLQIGVIIILTLAFNIVIPLFDMIFVSLLKCLRKCWDRRCYCTKTTQKTKKGYIQLYANDIYPIQLRYSDFIAMILISLAFSAVMPILYIILFLSIWFMFICDKLLLFKVYQKPINYNQDLQNNVFKIVYAAVMIHCVSSAFILSQKHLTLAGNASNLSRFNTILTTPYLIPYVVLFLILAIWAVFYSTIVNFVTYCAKKCEKELGKVYKSKLHQNFFNALNHYQINRLKMSIQMQLHTNLEHKVNNNDISCVKLICQNSLKKLNESQRTLVNNRRDDNVYLIGRAGYDQMFDDEIFVRERKIKSIDYQFSDIFKTERSIKRLPSRLQLTNIQLNS